MKWLKNKSSYMFSKYVREDGKYTIESTDNEAEEYGYPRTYYYKVTGHDGTVIEFTKTMKEAKEKYKDL